MNYQHKELAAGLWKKLSLLEQLGNIGSEVERTINWKKKGDIEYSNKAFNRALELIDITIEDEKNMHRLREITRIREVLVDFFMYDNIYGSTDEKWQDYFYQFAYAARVNK